MAENYLVTPAKYPFIVFRGNNPEAVRDSLLRRGNLTEVPIAEEENMEVLAFIWRPFQYPFKTVLKIDKINSTRKYTKPLILNHIDALKGITNKSNLLRSLRRLYTTHAPATESKYTLLDSVPETFTYEIGGDESEFLAFTQRYAEISQSLYRKDHTPAKHCKGNVWLIKPANMNQGRGIEIVKNLKEVKGFFEGKPVHSQWVIQKYIEKPLLYRGRKFDIRVWVLVTDRADVFCYKEGYIRTASNDYTLETSENYVHLTNNCLQKHGYNYGKHEDGNTLPFLCIREYIKEIFSGKGIDADFDKHVFLRIKDLVIDTILSVKSELMVSIKKRGCAFELLGYDFMIDEDLRVWLIEVNTNPYLGTPNQYIKNLLPRMLDNLFDLTLKFAYPRVSPQPTTQNGFELIYCEKNSLYSSEAVNKHRGYGKDLIYPFKELFQENSPARNLSTLRILCKKVASKHRYKDTTSHARNKTVAHLYTTGFASDHSRWSINKRVVYQLESVHKKILAATAASIVKSENFCSLSQFLTSLLSRIKSCSDAKSQDDIIDVLSILKINRL